MRVKLKPLMLEKKKGSCANSGNPQTIIYVLIIAMLVDDELYMASSAASTVLDPTEDRENYRVILNALRSWLNSPGKGITKCPDNGPKGNRTTSVSSAMWYGETFKEHVGAAVWNLVVAIFDQVCAMNEADQAEGLTGVTYWWDSEEERIFRKTPKQVNRNRGSWRTPLGALGEAIWRHRRAMIGLGVGLLIVTLSSYRHLFFSKKESLRDVVSKYEYQSQTSLPFILERNRIGELSYTPQYDSLDITFPHPIRVLVWAEVDHCLQPSTHH